MPNYVLSRTSPPAHIYERKLNLGYGVKIDTSDAPQPNKGKIMNDKSLEVAERPDAAAPVNGQHVIDVDSDGKPVNPIAAQEAPRTEVEGNKD